MAYCTITDVEALLASRGAFSASTKPTSTQVNTMITLIAGEINSILTSRGLSVDVTSPTELVSYLTLVNALGGASQAESAMNPAASMGSSHASRLEKRYQECLTRLREDEISTLMELQPWGYLGDLAGDDDEPEPYFTQDKVF